MFVKRSVRWAILAVVLVMLLATPNIAMAGSGGGYQGGCNGYYYQGRCCYQGYYPQSGCCYQGGGNGCWRPVYPPWNPWNPPSYHPWNPPSYHPWFQPQHHSYPWHSGW